jgi:glycerol kinase
MSATPASELLLAIDQGTTNSKAVLVDADGAVVARGSAPLSIRHPAPGWVEHDASELWQSVVEAVRACLQFRPNGGRIAGVAISNQRESMVAWHAVTGEPLGPCVSWQCRRTAARCSALRAAGHERTVMAKTGLPLDPMFGATKASWLLGHVRERRPDLSLGDVRLGTVDAWLLHNTSGGARFACDASNASRTQLFDITTGRWDETLGELFGVPVRLLPEVLDSDAEFGVTEGFPGVPDGTPIRAMLGDSHAALFGHGVDRPGVVKATYGTGSSLMTPLAEAVAPQHGVTTTVAWSREGKRTYALEGNILVSAASLPWASELLGLGGDPGALAALAETVPSSGGVDFVPALIGLGAPHWDSRALGLVSGLTFRTGRAELARAVMESIALQVADVFDAMRAQSPHPLSSLLADGGPSANTWLMGIQADLIGVGVIPSDAPEASALGAAYMAGLALGRWPSLADVPALRREAAAIEPRSSEPERERRRATWRGAVARARLAPEP